MTAPCDMPLSYPYPISPQNTLEEYEVKPDMRVFAPAAGRNKEPIRQVLLRHLSPLDLKEGHVLEIGSGTGEHIAHFASVLPKLIFQPTDNTSDLFPSVQAHASMNKNVRDPFLMDACQPLSSWPVNKCESDAVICINVTHIAPFEATLGLLDGAVRVLKPGTGLLFIYSPFTVNGEHTADSNETFDDYLRETNPEWGIRDVQEIQREAEVRGLESVEVAQMPANNLTLVFKKI